MSFELRSFFFFSKGREGRGRGRSWRREKDFQNLTLAWLLLPVAVYIFCQVKRNELLRRGFILKQVWPIHSALFLALVPDALACPGHSDTSWALALIQHLNSSPTAIPKKVLHRTLSLWPQRSQGRLQRLQGSRAAGNEQEDWWSALCDLQVKEGERSDS